jgi:MFS family permease
MRLKPFGIRNFRLLFLGRSISFLGSSMAPIALAFAVLDLTGSAIDLGLVVGAGSAANVLLLLVGGVWADRLRRNRVMVAADIATGAAQGLAAILLISGRAEVWHLAVLSAAMGAGFAFFGPASTGIVPEIVPNDQLQEANALLRLSRDATRVGGAVVGGAMVALIGPALAVGVDAATYIVSAMLLGAMRLPAGSEARMRNFVAELAQGWSAFWTRTWLWATVLGFMVINAFWAGSTGVLVPVVADRDLGGPAVLGILSGSIGAGLVLGGVLALRITVARPLLTACAAITLAAPYFVLVAIPAPLIVLAAAAVLAGAGQSVFGILWHTTLQSEVPRELISRVSAYDQLGSFAVIPIGAALAGPASEAVGVSTLLVATAVVLAAVCLVLIATPAIRQVAVSTPATR